jgi:hypothetical protein
LTNICEKNVLCRFKTAWTAWRLTWAELARWQKVLAICLLLFYIAMIGLTIATAPYSNATRNNQTVPQTLN